MVDKVIITNRDALSKQHGPGGLAAVEAAINRLIAADGARGIVSQRVYIDDAGEMTVFGTFPVVAPADERGAKRCVDAVFTALDPDYVLLLGGPEIVPHIMLKNPKIDLDGSVPSDLPYASPSPWSESPQPFFNVTRVVGRVPGLAGTAGTIPPTLLVDQLDRAAAHKPRPKADYENYFAISAQVWKVSTQINLARIFEDHRSLKISPKAAHPTINPDLAALSHFINCHGGNANDAFYGDNGVIEPPKCIESAKLSGLIRPDTVVAAECCYGAQLYDPSFRGIPQPICLTYLAEGAIGFLGSTNIAYGSSDDTNAADLLTQYFLLEILKGASLGRALLQARQTFVSRTKMSDDVAEKTLAQFILLGDPSVHPCIPPAVTSEGVMTAEVDPATARRAARVILSSKGPSLASAASKRGKPVQPDAAIAVAVENLASRKGFKKPTFRSYAVTGGAAFKASMKAMIEQPVVTVAVDIDESAQPAPRIRILVTHSIGQNFASVVEYESR